MEYDYKRYWEKSEEERKGYYAELYSWARNFYDFTKDAKILDVAGGSGQLSHFFGLKNVTLLDISDSGLKIARKRFKFKAYKCNLVNELWPTRNKKFDFAICNEFLEHIYYPSIILNEINKSLKKGGILYIGQPNMTPDGRHHVKKIDYSYLKFILEENGFKIINRIIVPKLILSKFSDINCQQSFLLNIKLFLGAGIGFFLSKSFKFYIARKMPNFLGGFYHIKSKKIN